MRNIKALSSATVWSIALIAILTVLKEKTKPIGEFLQAIPPVHHHWVTKGIFALILFFGVYYFKAKKEEKTDILQEARIIMWASIVGFLIIVGFYIGHFVGYF